MNQSWNSPFLLAQRNKCMHEAMHTMSSVQSKFKSPIRGITRDNNTATETKPIRVPTDLSSTGASEERRRPPRTEERR
uniref:Uncharacterized protein n=1 Tax=Arundo donax TaxID=35708 RepID=A0A0A9BQ30_ARUDO